MDALTHTLVAVTAGAAGNRRWGWRGTLWLAAAANLPELERVTALGSTAAWVESGYGAGHSLLAVPVLALASGALLRRLGGWKNAAGIAALGLATHLALDLISGPGVRLLWPLSSQFYGRLLLARYDLPTLLVLLLALLFTPLLNLVNRDIGARAYRPETPARLGLAVLAMLLLFRGVVQVELNNRLSGSSEEYSLAPSPLHPLSWFLVRDGGPYYTVEEVTPVGFSTPLRLRKAQPNRAFETAAETRLGRAFLAVARFPQYSLENGKKGMLVRIQDLRFFTPTGQGKECSVEIEVTPELEVVAQRARW